MGNVINLPNITPESIVISNDELNSGYKTNEFNEKNYLNTRLEPGQKKKTITIRLLPMDLTTGNPFVKVHFHKVKVPKDVSDSPYGTKSYFCLSEGNKAIDHEKYGTKCPFCELAETAKREAEKEKDEIKKKNFKDVAWANRLHDAVITRCIERGKEDEGVKFWKFNVRFDKTDPYNTIINLYNQRKEEAERAGQPPLNILDIYNGHDLTITITEGNAAPQIIDTSFSTPLSMNEEQMKAWIYDDKKWQDVFSTKPYEYLLLISQMKVPWFDRKEKKWVDKEEYDKTHKNEAQDVENKAKKAEEAIIQQGTEPQVQVVQGVKKPDFVSSLMVKEDEDLPF